MRRFGICALGLAAGVGGLIAAAPARAAIDWASVPGKDVVLFYPGQASWEWALTPRIRPPPPR